jgi:1-acyl-sn-glycerol-3-phosphate acyltransferase
MPRLVETLRFDLRVAGFVGVTAAMYGLLEVDVALRGASKEQVLERQWTERYGRRLLQVFGVQVSARGPHLGEGQSYPGADARGKGRVFIMNHRSSMDTLLAISYLDAKMVSRADLARWPVIGPAARRVGTLFVDRTSKSSGAAVINAMCGALERGQGVCIFPEGTTYTDDEVRPFHPGAFAAAARTGAEIVPVGLAYQSSNAIFGDESFGEHMRRLAGSPTTPVAMVVGEPLPPSDDRDALKAQAHQRLQSLVDEARKVFTAG